MEQYCTVKKDIYNPLVERGHYMKKNSRLKALKYIVLGVLLLVQSFICTSCYSKMFDWIDIDIGPIEISDIGTRLGKAISSPSRILGIVLLIIGTIILILAITKAQAQHSEDLKFLNEIENGSLVIGGSAVSEDTKDSEMKYLQLEDSKDNTK